MNNIARQQAGGLDSWAAVLEAHEPASSAKGILMLRAAAKTLRRFADAPGRPWEAIETATLYIDALNWLSEGYRHQDKDERMDALRDTVNITGDNWRNALNQFHTQEKQDG